MLHIFEGPLPVSRILSEWYEDARHRNFGAFIPFVGTVRDEDQIEGLSFDLYRPLLERWFEAWQAQAAKEGAQVAMAHSQGDVPLFESSYVAAVFSPKRRVALSLIERFVEDFKANAPIWKYDLRDGKRIYAADRSQPLEGSGLLGR